MNRIQLEAELDALAAEIDFAGVVRVDRPDHETFAKAYGFAHRGYAILNTVDARLAVASMTKGFTALAVVSLMTGSIELGTTARSLLGTDLPMIAGDVTIEDLLAHRSGIGDYLDEELHPDVAEYVMPVPVHELASAEDYLAVLDGHEAAFAGRGRSSPTTRGRTSCSPSSPSERAACRITNSWPSAYSAGQACTTRTSPRSDELAGAVAQGLHRGSTGAFGATCCTCRCAAWGMAARTRPSPTCGSFWTTLFAGDIVPPAWRGPDGPAA